MNDKVLTEFQWAEKYKLEGARAFSETSQKSLRLIQGALKTNIGPFFDKLVGKFGSQQMSKEKDMAGEVNTLIRATILSIDDLMLINPRTNKDELVQGVFNNMQQIRAATTYFSNPENISVGIKQKLDEIQQETGISASGLNERFSAIQGRMQILEKPKSKFEKFKEKHTTLGGIATTASGIAKDVGHGIVNEFGILGQLGRGIYEARKQKKAQASLLEQQKFSESVIPPGGTAEDYQKTYKGLFGGKAKIPEDISGKSRSTLSDKAVLVDGLTTFFSGPALKTKWTQSLLEALGGIGIGGKSAEIKQVTSIIPMLGNIAKIAGPALAIAGAGIVGWKAGSFINERMGIGKAIQGQIASNVTATHREEQIKSADTLERKATIKLGDRQAELMRSGMSQVDAMKQAKAEMMGEIQPGIATNNAKVVTPQISQTFGEIDTATGLPKDKSKIEAFKKQNDIKVLGPELAKVQEIQRTKVPIDTTMQTNFAETKKSSDAVVTSIKEMTEEIKKKDEKKTTQVPSGYDAYNVRNPLIASMNTGGLDVA